MYVWPKASCLNIASSRIFHPWVTYCIVETRRKTFIVENSIKFHAEMKALTLLEKVLTKNCNVNMTVIRIRYTTSGWEYSYTLPCTHCKLRLNKYQKDIRKKYGSKTNINIRWSLDSDNLTLTNFVNVNNIGITRISTGWAAKLNKYQQLIST